MKTSQNTILIVGGSAGIGLEIAKQFSALNNHVIITGRNQNRLDSAVSQLHNVTAIQSDVSNAAEVNALVHRIKTDFPNLNLVINNAGHAAVYNLADETIDAYKNAEDEMMTNYLSIIRLNQKLLPLLKNQQEAAIVNVSSVVAFAPGIYLPTYAASKAALHSYTTSLRLTLSDTSVKVFELMPPLVDTEFSKAIGGANGIKPAAVAEALLHALTNDEYEIHVGDTAKIYALYLASPESALQAMNAQRLSNTPSGE